MRGNKLERVSAVLVMALLSGSGCRRSAPQGAPAPDARSYAGRWDAVVVANGVDVPFVLEIVAEGTTLKASFFNGERRITSSPGRFEDSVLVLPFDQYAAKLRLSAREGGLSGEYQRARGGPLPIRAVRPSGTPAISSDAPSIEGTWIVGAKSSKGRDRLAIHREAVGRRGLRNDSSRRW